MLKKSIYLLLIIFSTIVTSSAVEMRETNCKRYATGASSFVSALDDAFHLTYFSQAKRAKSPRMRTRFSVAPLISLYTINEHHARKPHQKASAVASLKEEIRMNNSHNVFFLFGAEYMLHGMNFNTYYFKPNEIQLYNDDMAFNYSLYIHEIDMPLQVKLSLRRENNSLFTPYFMFGYHLRYMFMANLKVTENGNPIITKDEDITFKNPLVTNKFNPFVSITYGLQKNNPNNTRTAVFAEITYRQGLSPYLLSDTFTPSSLYINGSHFSFGLGVKF